MERARSKTTRLGSNNEVSQVRKLQNAWMYCLDEEKAPHAILEICVPDTLSKAIERNTKRQESLKRPRLHPKLWTWSINPRDDFSRSRMGYGWKWRMRLQGKRSATFFAICEADNNNNNQRLRQQREESPTNMLARRIPNGHPTWSRQKSQQWIPFPLARRNI